MGGQEDEWEEEKDKMRNSRRPFIVIKGKDKGRGIQAAKVQDMMGEYYIWEMPVKRKDVEIIKKMSFIALEM